MTVENEIWKPRIMGMSININSQVRFQNASHMCSSHLHRVDAGDGVEKVVSFINNDNTAFQLHTNRLTSWSMEESIVG